VLAAFSSLLSMNFVLVQCLWIVVCHSFGFHCSFVFRSPSVIVLSFLVCADEASSIRDLLYGITVTGSCSTPCCRFGLFQVIPQHASHLRTSTCVTLFIDDVVNAVRFNIATDS